MKFDIKLIFNLLCLLVFTTATYGQVTIGSSKQPVQGALLQLQNINDSQNSLINADKGLLLPRVDLVEIKSLSPCLTGTITQEDKLSHLGLVLYNTNTVESEDICPGMYYWNGDEWKRLYGSCKKEVEEGIELEQSKYTWIMDGLSQKIKFKSKGAWTATVQDTQNIIDGGLSQVSGDAGDIELDLTMMIKTAVGNNPSTETASIIISSAMSNLQKTITIEGIEMTFIVPNNIYVDVDGYFLGTEENMPVTALSNSTRSITITSDASWLTLNNKTLTSDANNASTDRVTSLIISNGATSKQVEVKQDKLIFTMVSSLTVPIKGYTSYEPLNVVTNSSRRSLTTTTNNSSWITINNSSSRTPAILVGRADLAARSGIVTVTLGAYRNASATANNINVKQEGRQGTGGTAGYFLIEGSYHRGYVNYIIDDVATMYITLSGSQEIYNAGSLVLGGVYNFQYNPSKSTTSVVSGVVTKNGSSYPTLKFTATKGFSFTIAFIDSEDNEYICRVVFQ